MSSQTSHQRGSSERTNRNNQVTPDSYSHNTYPQYSQTGGTTTTSLTGQFYQPPPQPYYQNPITTSASYSSHIPEGLQYLQQQDDVSPSYNDAEDRKLVTPSPPPTTPSPPPPAGDPYHHLQRPPSYTNNPAVTVFNDGNSKQKHPPPADSTTIEMGILPDNAALRAASLQTDRQVRMAFVRKVYFLLIAQLAVTIGISALFMNSPTIMSWVSENDWLFFVSWGVSLIVLLLLFWKRKSSPLNLILLFTFTLTLSYGVATVVSVYESTTVLQAFLITIGVFIALVIFTLQSRIDFSSWGPFLYMGLWVVIISSLVGWFFPYSQIINIAISGLSALLFCGYVIYDTYMIFNRLSPEEYILAAIDLYLDIINLFIAFLALLGGAESS